MYSFDALKEQNPRLDQIDYVVIDFETTGIHASIDDVVELGAVRIDSRGWIKDRFSSLINPGKEIPQNVINIHGITNHDVKDYPDPYEVVSQFIRFSQESLLVAHNARFDGLFLQKYLKAIQGNKVNAKPKDSQSHSSNNGKGILHWKGLAILDTVSLTRRIYPGLSSYSLTNLKQYWNIQTKRKHRGFDDAYSAAIVLRHCLERMEGERPAQFDFLKLWNSAHESYITGTYKPRKRKADHRKIVQAMETALRNENSVPIHYKNTRGEKTYRTIIPKKVFFNHTEAYVEAHCQLRGELRVFRVDRIELAQ